MAMASLTLSSGARKDLAQTRPLCQPHLANPLSAFRPERFREGFPSRCFDVGVPKYTDLLSIQALDSINVQFRTRSASLSLVKSAGHDDAIELLARILVLVLLEAFVERD